MIGKSHGPIAPSPKGRVFRHRRDDPRVIPIQNSTHFAEVTKWSSSDPNTTARMAGKNHRCKKPMVRKMMKIMAAPRTAPAKALYQFMLFVLCACSAGCLLYIISYIYKKARVVIYEKFPCVIIKLCLNYQN